MFRYFIFLVIVGVLSAIIQGCSNISNIGAGFGSYEKPAKTSNKYYTRNFKLDNPKLKIARQYIDLDNKGLYANNDKEYSYFVFFENGFVLHNDLYSHYRNDHNKKPLTSLKYSNIFSEDVGSYLLKGDTIFWGTRPGYMPKRKTSYYTGLVTDSGIKVINSKYGKTAFFRLR